MHRAVCKNFAGIALTFAAVGLIACGSKQAAAPANPTGAAPAAAKDDGTRMVKTEPGKAGDPAPPPPSPIYFDFDSYAVQDVSKPELQKVADYLTKYPGSTVTISGHTDERGTTEYNLMLGDQRAKSAHDYLVRLGIDPLRIKTISYGEERPAATGTGEENWKQNRRDEFAPVGGGDSKPSK